LLEEMGVLANVISYNAVIHAYARSGYPDAGQRAEKLLRDMWIKPNSRTYSSVMDAWSRSSGCADSAERANALLVELEEMVTEDESMKPNCVSYSIVINAYALSKTEPFKAHKAFSLLQRMVELSKDDPNVLPNRVTYNSVLNACATTCPIMYKDNLEKLGMDLPTLPAMVRTLYGQLFEIDGSIKPDQYTFGTVLKAIANLFWGEPDQIDFCKEVFKEACRRGEVSFGVLFQLRQAAPADVYRDLLPKGACRPDNGHFLMQNIPKDWTRNIRDDSRRRNS
jgi:hypothetical protein